MKSNAAHGADAVFTDLGGGVSRAVRAHTDAIMAVEVRFRSGASGAPHAHPHAQSTFVVSGAFRFTVEGASFTVYAGDTLAFAPGETHGCVCLADGALIDVFAPPRADFLPGDG